MPIFSVKRIIMPLRHKHSSRPLARSAEALSPFASFPHVPSFPSIPVLLGPLMLESHKLRYLFCQAELFSYH